MRFEPVEANSRSVSLLPKHVLVAVGRVGHDEVEVGVAEGRLPPGQLLSNGLHR